MHVITQRRYRTCPALPPTVAVGKGKVLPFCRGGSAPKAAGRLGAGRRPRLAPGCGAGHRSPSAAVASLSRESFSPGLASCGRCVPSQLAKLPAAGPRGARAARPAATRPSTGPVPPGRPSRAGRRRGGGRRPRSPPRPLSGCHRGTPPPSAGGARTHLSSFCQPWSPSSKSRNRYRGGSGGTSLSRSTILPGGGEHPPPLP